MSVNDNAQNFISADPEEILRKVREERKRTKPQKSWSYDEPARKNAVTDSGNIARSLLEKRGKNKETKKSVFDRADENEPLTPSDDVPMDAEQILQTVRNERKAKEKPPKKNEGENHAFFKFLISLNLLGDAAMCLYSAFMSKAPVITVGMAVLAMCFLIVVPGLILLRLTIRRSSAAITVLAYTAVNAMIGFVFGCEFFKIIPENAAFAEGTAIGTMVVLVVFFVNVLVKRHVDKNM